MPFLGVLFLSVFANRDRTFSWVGVSVPRKTTETGKWTRILAVVFSPVPYANNAYHNTYILIDTPLRMATADINKQHI